MRIWRRSARSPTPTIFPSATLDTTWPAEAGADGMGGPSTGYAPRRSDAVRGGINIIILSDREVGADRIPIPALLADRGRHHHLIRKGLRTSVGLVVETGEAREVHHFACWPATAPRRSIPISPSRRSPQCSASCRKARRQGSRQALHQVDRQGTAEGDVQDGHLDLSVLLRRADFRRGRPEPDFVAKYFTGTATRIEGVGLAEIAAGDGAPPSATPSAMSPVYRSMLDVGGEYAFRVRGEDARLDAADRVGAAARGARQFAGQIPAFARLINDQSSIC